MHNVLIHKKFAINKGFILSLEHLVDNKNITSYTINKFVSSLDNNIFSAIKINSYNIILDIKLSTSLPIIGYISRFYPNSFVSITPTINEIHELAKAGANIIYIDASMKIRPNNQTIEEFFYKIKNIFPELYFVGEVSTKEELNNIIELGFDAICINTSINDIDYDIDFCKNNFILNSLTNEDINYNDVFKLGFNNVIIDSRIMSPGYRLKNFLDGIV